MQSVLTKKVKLIQILRVKITAIVDVQKNMKLFKASNYVPDVHVKFKNLYKIQNFKEKFTFLAIR